MTPRASCCVFDNIVAESITAVVIRIITFLPVSSKIGLKSHMCGRHTGCLDRWHHDFFKHTRRPCNLTSGCRPRLLPERPRLLLRRSSPACGCVHRTRPRRIRNPGGHRGRGGIRRTQSDCPLRTLRVAHPTPTVRAGSAEILPIPCRSVATPSVLRRYVVVIQRTEEARMPRRTLSTAFLTMTFAATSMLSLASRQSLEQDAHPVDDHPPHRPRRQLGCRRHRHEGRHFDWGPRNGPQTPRRLGAPRRSQGAPRSLNIR